ncbi:FimV/HubP family polar landmark protein [Thalassomonas sp. RHCl1]|uniref:FimV/HubP family polar landmark protein n=1 Tax=Thalassomonas sp. RHCl1 TaxID=2995320 RepID=UPI00248C37CD|nr:FimV/HubP family polar landmark protein [Thalassomonas sp. RHCl1]
MIKNKVNAASISIATALISIDTPNCLGHQRIWPHRDEFIEELLNKLRESLINDHGIEFDVVSIEPGSINIRLQITASIFAIVAATATFMDTEAAEVVREKLEYVISEYIIQSDYSEPCNVHMLGFAKRGLCYGPVQQGDTLTSIAEALNPNGVTTNQTLMALYKYNPHAFYDENINNLHDGVFLSLPKSPKYLSKNHADEQVELHNEKWRK